MCQSPATTVLASEIPFTEPVASYQSWTRFRSRRRDLGPKLDRMVKRTAHVCASPEGEPNTTALKRYGSTLG